jgi:hypothetical protein
VGAWNWPFCKKPSWRGKKEVNLRLLYPPLISQATRSNAAAHYDYQRFDSLNVIFSFFHSSFAFVLYFFFNFKIAPFKSMGAECKKC